MKLPSAVFLLSLIACVSTASATEIAPAIRDQVEHNDSAELREFYVARDFAPAWADRERGIAITALAQADKEGLNPSDYHIAYNPRPSTVDAAARQDIALTATLLRYARDLHNGRLLPGAVYGDADLPAPPFNPVPALVTALQTGTLAAFVAALPPQYADYAFLRQALSRYRSLAAQGAVVPLAAMKGSVADLTPAEQHALRQRLEWEGFAGNSAESTTGSLAIALKAFQTSNGLVPDGKLGPKTMQALNISAAYRVQQIEANMERWRWLPHQPEDRYIAVNTADTTLTVVEGGKVVLASRVVTGKPKTPTPLLSATVTAVTVNPPWNVPYSIAAGEILPKLRRDPTYLTRQNMILQNGPPNDPHGLTVDWQHISASSFPFRIQQVPGEKNALGRLKLEMPNRLQVYLHDTPAKALFSQPERFFSHGCIRVQKVTALAQYALTGDPASDVARLIQPGSDTRRLPLEKPLKVYVLYWTAFRGEDGAVAFRNDVYGRDAQLIAALSNKRITLSKPSQTECSA